MKGCSSIYYEEHLLFTAVTIHFDRSFFTQKPVSTLCMMVDNTLLSGGGSCIKSWDSINNYRKISKREVRINIVKKKELNTAIAVVCSLYSDASTNFKNAFSDSRNSWKCKNNHSTTRLWSRRTDLRGNVQIVHSSRIASC